MQEVRLSGCQTRSGMESVQGLISQIVQSQSHSVKITVPALWKDARCTPGARR